MLPNPRRPLWGEPANSHIRPKGDGQGGYPISIVKAYWDTGDRPVFGKQIDIQTASTRPQAAYRGYVSISAGRAPAERIEWPVFGEQLDDLTATPRPQPAVAASKNQAARTSGYSAHCRHRSWTPLNYSSRSMCCMTLAHI